MTTKYTVITESDPNTLSDTINRMLELGWQLQGGVTVSRLPAIGMGASIYAQAVFKTITPTNQAQD